VEYQVKAGAFWQPHRDAPGALIGTVMRLAADVLAGGPVTVWDLYCGSGLFTVPLAAAAPEGSAVWAVEADPAAIEGARRNTRGRDGVHLRRDGVHLRRGDVAAVGPTLPAPDLVVLDPPRRGAGGGVSAGIVQARPERVIYVACDPAALARDTATLIHGGYRLDDVVGLDLFPHTHHVECVASFTRA
jgi:tRNA/tmRNA/rRNA uracil-C5-methylase (TrmA/RlmC/RlmD family)